MRRRTFLQMAASAPLLLPASRLAAQAAWPSGPIELVVPFPPGGPTDTAPRILLEHLQPLLGQRHPPDHQQARRRRRRRLRACRAQQAGRLHGAGHQQSSAQRADRDREEGHLQDRGFHPARHVCGRRRNPGGAAATGHQEHRGADRAGEAEAGRAQLRLGRAGHRDACLDRIAQARGRHQDRARAVSRIRAGGPGDSRRPCPAHVVGLFVGQAAGGARRCRSARHHGGAPAARSPERADAGREGLRRHRGQHLDGLLHAVGHPAADRAEVQPMRSPKRAASRR